MSRELLILRHAKSDWEAPADRNRELARRGRREAPRVGEWLAEADLIPDAILCSPAVRARQTLAAVLERLEIPGLAVTIDERIYAATLPALLEVLADCPLRAQRVLLVGHNPGLDDLVTHLLATPPPLTAKGKLMTTAALAHCVLPDDWSSLAPGCARLLHLKRPRE